MKTLINTIALEPNRWTKEKIPAHDLEKDLLPRIGASAFNRVELWQYHCSPKSIDEIKVVRDLGAELDVTFPVLGAYPAFHLEGEEAEAEERELMGLIDRASILGVEWIKFFFGAVRGKNITPEELERTTTNVSKWIAYGKEKGLKFCAELHNGTIFQPFEYGRDYLAAHPELEIKICFQPYDFVNTEPSLGLIQGLGTQIVHAHFQGRNADGHCLLKDAAVDYKRIVQALNQASKNFIPSIEFVTRGFPKKDEAFDFDGAIADAEADASFLEALL